CRRVRWPGQRPCARHSRYRQPCESVQAGAPSDPALMSPTDAESTPDRLAARSAMLASRLVRMLSNAARLSESSGLFPDDPGSSALLAGTGSVTSGVSPLHASVAASSRSLVLSIGFSAVAGRTASTAL